MNREKLLIKLKNLKNNNESNYQIISSYILSNLKIIGSMGIDKLAKNTFSSIATINRFCQFIGLIGYKEMIKILTSDESENLSSLILNMKEKRTEINKIINESLFLWEEETLDELILDLKQKKEILLMGYGESLILLKNFASRLLRVGIEAKVFSSIEDMIVYVNNIGNDSVVIVLSLSGKTKVIIDAATIAKNNGAKIYSITRYSNNAVKKLSDKSFDISYDPIENHLISRTPRYAIIFLLDIVFEKIMESDPKKYNKILIKTKK